MQRKTYAMEDIFKCQIKLLERRNTLSDMNYILDGINCRRKAGELEDIAIAIIQNKTQRKETKRMIASCISILWDSLSSLSSSPKRRTGKKKYLNKYWSSLFQSWFKNKTTIITTKIYKSTDPRISTKQSTRNEENNPKSHHNQVTGLFLMRETTHFK